MDDLFGHGHGPAQASLFGDSAERMPDSPSASVSYLPDPADIRRRLRAVLATARGAEAMPWTARKARMWRTVFPQMANWLPDGEAADLRAAFAAEMARLEG